MAQKTCSDWYTCFLRVWCLQIHYEGVSGPQSRQFWPCKSCDFLEKKFFNIRAPRVNYRTLKRQDTPIKVIRLKITNWEFILHDGGSTRCVLFKMATVAIFDFETLLPFLYHLTDRHQKYSRNIRTSIWNISMTSAMHSCKISRRWLPPFWISKTVAICLLFDQSSPNL